MNLRCGQTMLGLGAVPGCQHQSIYIMDKNTKQLILDNKWRELLMSISIGKTAITVSSVGEIKSIRSVASDLNTDKGIEYRFSISADRDLFLVEIDKARKDGNG